MHKVYDNYYGMFFHVLFDLFGKPVMAERRIFIDKMWMYYGITLCLN